ncbi:MAG: GNAT family N-acetyltransferase, partial [Turicibacter sp.]
MSKTIEIKGKPYRFECGYQDNESLRNSFNQLTEKTYGFEFKQWYEDGYWTDKYVPYSLIDGDQVVANVSVNIMDFLVRGEEKRFIQIGTVMTDESYRNQGLSKALIEIVLKEYEEKCDLIYLFANDSVIDFYPKFGFKKSEQYQYATTLPKTEHLSKLKKLDMNHDSDRELVYQLASSTCSYSKLSMINNPSLIMFYATYFMK